MAKLFLKGKSLGSIKGVLFDKDGTISNSEKFLFQLGKARIKASKNLFSEKCSGIKIIELEKFLMSTYGLTSSGVNPNGILAIASEETNLLATATVFSLLGENWSKALKFAKEIFNKAYIEKSFSSSLNEKSTFPGVRNFLQSLSKAKVPSAIISNDTKSGIKDFLIKNDLEKYIQTIWSSEDIPTKPNPGAIYGLCKTLRINPSDCALIGDSDTDLEMAKQAGIIVRLGFVSGWSYKPALNCHQELINNWHDLSVS